MKTAFLVVFQPEAAAESLHQQDGQTHTDSLWRHPVTEAFKESVLHFCSRTFNLPTAEKMKLRLFNF